MYCSMRWHARCCITDGLMIIGLSASTGSLADKTTNIMVTIGWWSWYWWWWWWSWDWAHPQEVLKTKEEPSALVSVVREADYRHQQSLMIRLYLYLYLMSYFVYIYLYLYFYLLPCILFPWYKRQTIATTNRAGVNSHLHFTACHTTYCVMGELQQNILNPKRKCWTKTWAIWLLNWYHFNLWGIK